MNINLNLLRVFYTVIEQRGVVRAAEKLFVSQSAVSSALKKLQKELGVSAFEKKGRFLNLSAYGKELYKIADKMHSLELDIYNLTRQEKNRLKPCINIGLVTIYERFGFDDIREIINKKDVSIVVSSGNSKAMIEKLSSGSIDIAVTALLSYTKEFIYSKYKKHKIYLVVPSGHRLYKRKFFSSKDLLEEKMVLKEKGSAVRKITDTYFSNYTIPYHSIAELSNIDSILDIVRNENCITFLPDLSLEGRALDDISILTCTDYDLCFVTYIMSRKADKYPQHIQEIVNELHTYYSSQTI